MPAGVWRAVRRTSIDTGIAFFGSPWSRRTSADAKDAEVAAECPVAHRLRWGPPDEPTIELAVGDGAVFVRGPRRGYGSAHEPAFEPPRADELSVTLMVQSKTWTRIARFRAAILLDVETYDFGERQYSARDLGGYVWTFTQSVQDVEPHDWGATTPQL